MHKRYGNKINIRGRRYQRLHYVNLPQSKSEMITQTTERGLWGRCKQLIV
jgi:hypothetical protein